MFLETNDIVEKFAKRFTVIGEVKLVDTNANCPKPSIGKTINFYTGNINVIKSFDLTGQSFYLSGIFMEDKLIMTHNQKSNVSKYSHIR